MEDVNIAGALADLYTLQERDQELDKIKEQQELLPPELIEARKKWAELSARLGQLKERYLTLQREYKQNDLEIKDLTAKRKQAEDEQMQSSSVREQTQFENRIQQLSTRIDELTELTMPILEEMENLAEQIQALEAEMAEMKPELDALEAKNAERVAQLEAEYQEKLAKREEMAASIPKNLLREYQAIRRARKGVGVALVYAKGGVYRCSACSVQLPTHVAQRVYQGQQVVRCPSCGRLLWKGPEQPSS
ncbi:zinc ribbon domain-containing protein [Oceanithermus profundus]